MKVNIGKILKAVGQGALVAAEFTPQGAAVGTILRKVAKVTGDNTPAVPGDLDGDGIPDIVDLQAVAVEAVMEALPAILPILLTDLRTPSIPAVLLNASNGVRVWLESESIAAQRKSQTTGKESK